nr:hypothetical protein [Candidatus Sigynarchaeota archaeon]
MPSKRGMIVEPWRSFFKYDPIPALVNIGNLAIQYRVRHDLLGDNAASLQSLWSMPGARRILKKQLDSGEWPDPRKNIHEGSSTNYGMVETYRNLGVLVEMFGFTRDHPGIQNAVEYLFTTQHHDGDFRGIYGNQYSPNYSAGILELIVRAGYSADARIDRAFRWFLDHQQREGGWTLPMQTHGVKSIESEAVLASANVYPFQLDKPFSHMVTGIVLRAFAAHEGYAVHPDAQKAGRMITSRFFRDDIYSSRKAASYWTKYMFPFWWTDLISVLDALSKMSFSKDLPSIHKALDYFRNDQQPGGYWIYSILKNKSAPDLAGWITWALCKVVKRFFR